MRVSVQSKGVSSSVATRVDIIDSDIADCYIEKGADGKGLIITGTTHDRSRETILYLEWQDIEALIKEYRE